MKTKNQKTGAEETRMKGTILCFATKATVRVRLTTLVTTRREHGTRSQGNGKFDVVPKIGEWRQQTVACSQKDNAYR